MNHSPRNPSAAGLRLLRVAGIIAACAVAGLSARADSAKKAAPAPTADLAALKEAVNALAKGPMHEIADGQAEVNARIDGLEAQVQRAERLWQGVDLAQLGRDAATTRGAVAGLLAEQAGVARQVGGVDAKILAAAEDAAAARKDWTRQLTLEDERLAKWQQEAKEAQERWEQQVSAGNAAVLAAQQDALRAQNHLLAYVLAGMGLITGAAVWWQGRARRAAHREVLLTLSRIAADLRHNPAKTALPATVTEPQIGEWQQLETRLRLLTERWEALAAAPVAALGHSPAAAGSAAAAPTVRNGAGGSGLKAWPTSRFIAKNGVRTFSSGGDKPTVSVEGMTEPSVASRLLWPGEFLDPESPLSRWRFLLESHFDDESRPALPVLGSLLGLRAMVARPGAGPGEVASAAFRLSESLYLYLQSLPELSADDCQQASAAWLQSIRRLIASAAPRIELREVLPDARIDLDLMHPVREGPGNHLSVADVFSWAVLDRSVGDRPKVLHRALVASS